MAPSNYPYCEFQSDEESEDEESDIDEDGSEVDESGDDNFGREQMVDGVRVVRTHAGDYSNLQSKAANLFSFNRKERIRWKDIIYGGKIYDSAPFQYSLYR